MVDTIQCSDLLLGIDQNDLSDTNSRASGTYVFFSFDLVNSTTFKTKNSDWPIVFDGFYNNCETNVFNEISRSQLWKRVGDEVLFYCPIISQEKIPELLLGAFTAAEACINWLNDATKDRDRTMSIKATIWAAFVEEIDPQTLKEQKSKRNFVIKPKSIHDAEIDFLGPDIDIGFRIARFAMPGKLVVDAKLAFLASKQKPPREKPGISAYMRIVSFETLKGVWDGRRYPIIWFHKSWDTPQDMFLYDESYESTIVKELDQSSFKTAKSVDYVWKILSDLNKTYEIDDLTRGIEIFSKNNPKGIARRNIPRERLCEIHLVCVCVNKRNEVMIAKRHRNKRLFPGLWEFGCMQLAMNSSISDALVKYYKAEFGLVINHPNKVPLPIGTYDFYISEEERTIPGIIFVALAKQKTFRKGSFDATKHSEVKWVKDKDAKAIPGCECVSGFHERIDKALLAVKIFQSRTKI